MRILCKIKKENDGKNESRKINNKKKKEREKKLIKILENW